MDEREVELPAPLQPRAGRQPGQVSRRLRQGAARESRQFDDRSSEGAERTSRDHSRSWYARSKRTYLGDVYFSGGSRPHMTISVAESPPGRGVGRQPSIDLRFVGEVMAARSGRLGRLCVCDRRPGLARRAPGHQPRPHEVELRRATAGDEGALAGEAPDADSATTGRDPDGEQGIERLRRPSTGSAGACSWRSRRARRSRPSMHRSSARRCSSSSSSPLRSGRASCSPGGMARPIEAMQAAAARMGSGALDQRIDVSSADELGALAEEFNRMAARLEESYAGLEQKVEERTRELETALSELDEKSRELESGKPAQVGVPREHVARAADAAERDHRLLAGAAREALRRAQREAGGVRRGHPHVREPPARAHRRHPRPLQGRGRAGRARGRAVLADGGARAGRRDGARARDGERRRGHARGGWGRRTSSRATNAGSGR